MHIARSKMKKEDYKVLRTRKYYPYPSDWNIIVHSSKEAAEICGLSFSNIYFLHDKGFVTALYSTEEWLEIGKRILEKITSNEEFISGIFSEQKRRGERLKEISNSVIKQLDQEKDNSTKSLGELALEVKSHWIEYNNLELCWYVGADFLKEHVLEEIEKDNSQFSSEDFQAAVVPAKETFSAQEETDILEAGISIASAGSSIEKETDDLLKKYYWIPFGYDGPTTYDAAHYRGILDHLIHQNSLESLKIQLEKLRSRRNLVLGGQKETFDKYEIGGKIRRLVDDLGTMMSMADDRKEHISYAQIAYDRLLERLSITLKIDKTLLKYLDVSEMLGRFNDKEEIARLANGRQELFLDGIENHRVVRDTSSKALEVKNLLHEDLSENIKGVVASKGDGIKIKAPVKLLFVPEDMKKVEVGDIIVSPMTTPQFTSAVRKASAVITDEGGVTCHAAIISRELGIPCIIGTKIATKVLKDGDMIEVDANKGIIKKICN